MKPVGNRKYCAGKSVWEKARNRIRPLAATLGAGFPKSEDLFLDQFTVRVKFCVVVADPEVAVIVRMYLPDGVLNTGGESV